MSDSAMAEALTRRDDTGGPAHRVALVLAKMPDDVRQVAEALLASDRSDRAVAEAMTADGWGVSQNAVRNYRVTNRLHRFAPRPD